MSSQPGNHVLKFIKGLYRSDPSARRLFEHAAARQRDARASTIEQVMAVCDIARADAVSLARQLQNAGCGEFRIGRRGSHSRIEWRYSLISLGQAASGESEDLEQPDREALELEHNGASDSATKDMPASRIQSTGTAMTIAEAKNGLSVAFGVPVSAVEITIKG